MLDDPLKAQADIKCKKMHNKQQNSQKNVDDVVSKCKQVK